MTGAETVSWGRGGVRGDVICVLKKEGAGGGCEMCACRWARAGGFMCFVFFFSFLVGSRGWWWKGRGGSGFWVWGCCDMRWEKGGFFGGYPRHFWFLYNRNRMRYCEGVLEAACPKG